MTPTDRESNLSAPLSSLSLPNTESHHLTGQQNQSQETFDAMSSGLGQIPEHLSTSLLQI